MKKFKVLILFSLVLTNPACKKAGNSDISGKVTEKGTGLPFPLVQVYVERTTRSGLNSNLDRTIVANTVTDANGYYEMDFFMNPKFLYDVYCKPIEDSYGKTYSKIGWGDIPKKNIVVDLQLPPIAYLKVNLHKPSSIVTKSAYLTIDNSASFELELPNHPFDSIAGIYRVVGNETSYISWRQGYGTPTYWLNGHDSFSINKNDTLDYTINFD